VAALTDLMLTILTPVLKVDMKESFGDLWEDVIIKKPPWSSTDLFHVLKKHWKSLYGNGYPKRGDSSVQDAFNFVKKYQERRGPDPTDQEM